MPNKKKRTVAIIGSHGLYANYGGWDQLVRNLAEKKSNEIEYLIFNSSDTKEVKILPPGVKVKRLFMKASGFQGFFYDFWSILICYWKVDTLLLLGAQGIPLIPVLALFRNVRIVTNVGGVEWERPKFNFLIKQYLKFCFNLSFKFSDSIILDNPHYKIFAPKKSNANILVIPYGGEIDYSMDITPEIEVKYPFISDEYFLSISRSLVDNKIDELCESFSKSRFKLVLISNLSNSAYGKMVLNKYGNIENIILIDGLYSKPELDLVRRKCKAYIHTHTLCGTAPSLVEMMISKRPIISVDNPQNRFTLKDKGFFYSSFSEMQNLLESKKDLSVFISSNEVCELYSWNKIVNEYELLY